MAMSVTTLHKTSKSYIKSWSIEVSSNSEQCRTIYEMSDGKQTVSKWFCTTQQEVDSRIQRALDNGFKLSGGKTLTLNQSKNNKMTDKQNERLVIALETIAGALANGASNVVAIPTTEPEVETPKETAKEKAARVKAEKAAKAKADKAAKAKAAKEEAELLGDDEDEPTATMSDLTTLGRKLVRTSKKPKLIAILEEHGIAKISATPKELWDEVHGKLVELGNE